MKNLQKSSDPNRSQVTQHIITAQETELVDWLNQQYGGYWSHLDEVPTAVLNQAGDLLDGIRNNLTGGL
jgi:uncharacterized membrane-anchored protein YhcB (DUF1043 family)